MWAKRLILVASAAVLSGCANPWHKPGATQAEFEQTLSVCQLEAQHAVPAVMAYRMTPGRTHTTSKCKDNKCTETTTYSPPAMTAYDSNDGVRAQYLRACLFRSGWSDEEEKK
ncbi:hypothetical protein [Oleispirillum naphthae]|uniref:hypothetical protein n=1 Tax=Oleispirillum naphthae TaxID=2838853 RepID=UPI0030822DDA